MLTSFSSVSQTLHSLSSMTLEDRFQHVVLQDLLSHMCSPARPSVKLVAVCNSKRVKMPNDMNILRTLVSTRTDRFNIQQLKFRLNHLLTLYTTATTSQHSITRMVFVTGTQRFLWSATYQLNFCILHRRSFRPQGAHCKVPGHTSCRSSCIVHRRPVRLQGPRAEHLSVVLYFT
jgi:hypothetical protein